MPLIEGKSKKSFEKNIKTEMKAGKPLKQSLAIAYGMKRKAKKMAKGGKVEEKPKSMKMAQHEAAEDEDQAKSKFGLSDKELAARGPSSIPFAKGGSVADMLHGIAEEHLGKQAQEHEDLPHPLEQMTGKKYYADEENKPMGMLGNVAQAIMKKKKLMMAQGGQIPEKLDYLREEASYPDPDGYELDSLDPDSDEMFPDAKMDASEDAKKKKKKILDMVFANMGKDEESF